jgi:hypothetical protein
VISNSSWKGISCFYFLDPGEDEEIENRREALGGIRHQRIIIIRIHINVMLRVSKNTKAAEEVRQWVVN